MITTAVVILGVAIVVALLWWLARANPGSATSVAGMVERPDAGPRTERPPELKSWEADLLAASTGGQRGRTRVSRRLQPLIETALQDRTGLSMDDPAAAPILGDEWVFLCGGPRPASSPRMDVESAVAALLDRLDTASVRRGA